MLPPPHGKSALTRNGQLAGTPTSQLRPHLLSLLRSKNCIRRPTASQHRFYRGLLFLGHSQPADKDLQTLTSGNAAHPGINNLRSGAAALTDSSAIR
jgi:hypothetical protein